ncbi:MAG: HlyD family efflux transporter periplasmic adaptor subunit [Gammaproteobacteria bacterium]
MLNINPRRIGFSVLIFIIITIILGLTDIENAQQNTITVPEPKHNIGIGALGRIEPRSRVIRVTHNSRQDGGGRLEALLHQEADIVEKNEILAVLSDNRKRKAELSAAKAKIAALKAKLASEHVLFEFNKKEYERYQHLLNTSVISKSLADQKWLAYEQSKANVEQLQAEIAENRANFNVIKEYLADTYITAPISGTVVKVNKRPGELVDHSGLLEMADLNSLDVVAEIYENDMPRVKIGQSASIRLEGFDEPFSASVRQLGFIVKKNNLDDTDPFADRDNRVIEVRLSLAEEAISVLQHQIYRQVQVQIAP